MRFLRWAALILAITAGYFGAAGGQASAAALPTAGLAATDGAGRGGLVSDVQWRRRGYNRGWYRPRVVYYRRAYRPRYYGFARPRYYGPRVVCRVRYTAWGPRRVCFRRF